MESTGPHKHATTTPATPPTNITTDSKALGTANTTRSTSLTQQATWDEAKSNSVRAHPTATRTESDLEASMRESEEALESVTRSIQQSFNESATPGCSSSEHVQHHLLSPSASAKPSLVEQIMTQMDEVFTELLKEEAERHWFYRRSRTLCVKGRRMDEADIEEEVNMPMLRYQRLLNAVVLMSQNAVMAGSEGACSLDDDLATTTTEDGSLDTILKQLEAEKRRMLALAEQHNRPPVPLAEPEDEFLDDDAANNTDADVPNVPTSENVTPSDDIFLGSGPEQDNNMPTEMPTEIVSDSSSSPEHDPKRMNNTNFENHNPVEVEIDPFSAVNSNGLARSRKWLDFRLTELESLDWQGDGDSDYDVNTDYDMLEFADKYYNVQIANAGYTGALSKTVNMVRRRSLTEVIPMQELLHYTKTSTITQSHVHLYDPENVTIACSIFKDICKYMKSELKDDLANLAIRGMISYAIERVELRDEIFCQLIRQTNGCRHLDYTLRAWVIMGLCSASFCPSRTLLKYLLCYLRRHTEDPDQRIARYATYCLQNLSTPRKTIRRMPPSILEIEAMQNMTPLMSRIHFLDGQTRGVSIEFTETAGETLRKVQEKIDLQSLEGWALYESTPEHDRFIRETECIADIISDWEVKQRALANVSSPKKVPPMTAVQVQEYGKFIFCKRIFKPVTDMVNDPVESHLLYAQALHHNVQVDEFSVSTHMALQLAGLQAQVIHGDYDSAKVNRCEDHWYKDARFNAYDDPEDYVCQRILSSKDIDWRGEIASAHKKYGNGKSEEEAKVRYLAIISHFPLYGCIKFFTHYRGFWQYGIEFVIAVGITDIKFVSLQERTILCEYTYDEIELIRVNIEDNLLTIQLRESTPSHQKCYMFECLDMEDLANLLHAYTPKHGTLEQVKQQQNATKLWKPSDADWLKMNDDILAARRLLVTSGVMQKPPEQGMGLIKTAFKKLSGRACGLERTDEEVDVKSPYWSFSKLPFRTSMMPFESHEMEDVAIRIFNSTLVYAGLESVAVLEDIDLVGVVQTLITKCMENDDICNEFYLQLIKQTTDSEPNNRAALRYWHLMLMATSVMLPDNQLVVHYLNLHMRRHALLTYLEEGRCAQHCLMSLYRNYASKGRSFPPSYKEVVCVTKWNTIGHEILDPGGDHEFYQSGVSQPISVLLHLPDGQQIPLEYDSVSTAAEAMDQIKSRIGMRLDADGYGIFESSAGGWERFIKPEDKLADCLFRFEEWAKSNGSSTKDLRYLFKKRIFVAPYMNVNDPIEVDLLYNQSVTDVFEGKIHVTKADATRLCALRAQTEYSDYGHANHFDYTSVMRILPRHLRELINIADIQTVHKTLTGVSPIAANIAFLDVLKHWPLYGASFYEVTQSCTESLPRTVWLAVSQLGIHLMEHRGQTVFSTYSYREISQCTPAGKSVAVTLTSLHSPKLAFSTPSVRQATEIAELVMDYKDIMMYRTDSNNGSDLPSKESPPPIVHPNHVLTSVDVNETKL